ncbi:MAG TPA: ROK family protein [Thermomicrobiales bacterium]|nr:ROK family protein [Thermomicrobiales bacterium]
MQVGPVLGIDIGGTKLAAGVVPPDGRVLSYVRAPTPDGADAETLLATVVALAQRARRESGATPVAVGIGCGGPMVFPEGIVSPLHIPAWRDFPLRARLEEALGLPAKLDNDAKAFALGEARFGAGRGARCLLGMVVSTGVGGGIVVGGKLLDGASGNAGHVGHVIVSAQGPRCYCGAIGCLTVYASGTGLVARARAALARDEASILATLPPNELTGEAIANAARRGDPLAARLMRDAAHALARGIASATVLLDLDRAVLGGGLAQTGALLFVPLRQELTRRIGLSFARDVEVVPAALGPEAGVVGAAALALPAEVAP